MRSNRGNDRRLMSFVESAVFARTAKERKKTKKWHDQ
jgi:hypothetical protein